jgi:hypothetical protein
MHYLSALFKVDRCIIEEPSEDNSTGYQATTKPDMEIKTNNLASNEKLSKEEWG